MIPGVCKKADSFFYQENSHRNNFDNQIEMKNIDS